MPKVKAEAKEEEIDSKPYVITKKRTAGKAWTRDEIVMLFKFVEKHGITGRVPWDEAVPGRTGSQASKTWKTTYSPFVVSELMKKGK